MLKTHIVALIVLTALSGPSFASGSLMPHQAEYKVRMSIVSGKLRTELRQTDDGYIARHVIRLVGISRLLSRGTINITSEFASGANGIVPISYKAVDTVSKDPEIDLRFDWDANVASGTVGGEQISLQLEGISHDSVSIQYALMHDLMNGGAKTQYELFDIDKIRVANITIVGTKNIKTKAGRYQAIGIRHQKEGSSRTTTLWCAEELGYLPVIIEQHRNGKLNFRATLVKYIPTESASQD